MRFNSLQFKLPLSVTVCMLTLGIALVTYAGFSAQREAWDKARLKMQTIAREHSEAIRQRLESGMAAARSQTVVAEIFKPFYKPNPRAIVPV